MAGAAAADGGRGRNVPRGEFRSFSLAADLRKVWLFRRGFGERELEEAFLFNPEMAFCIEQCTVPGTRKSCFCCIWLYSGTKNNYNAACTRGTNKEYHNCFCFFSEMTAIPVLHLICYDSPVNKKMTAIILMLVDVI